MRQWSFLLVLSAGLASIVAEDDDGEWRTVRTTQGSLRGRKDPTGDFYAFYNIRYATAPTGRDRFKAPHPGPVWFTTLDAVNEHIICPQAQLGLLPHKLKLQENCLIANVYVPDTDEKNLPVIVYVHGGAFQVGYGDLVTYKGLLKTKKVIVVTFNYRLGAHGFLCLGTKDAPGNAGMKDQVALLRWVNKNIASFGGNPKDVTIAGYSAGSVSVDLLMISKAAEGLFNKVIPESGSNVGVFSIQSDPLENAKAYAKALNFHNVDDIYALEEFYMTAPFELLTSDPFFNRTDSTFVFTPCVERKDGNEAFLDDSPLNILKKGTYKKLPLLYGFASMEGIFRLDYFDTWKDMMNEDFSQFLPADLQFENDNEREKVAKEIKEFYFGNKLVDETSVLKFVDYFSDVMFAFSTLWATKLHVEAGHNQIYLYEYSYVDENSPLVLHTNVRGATHCAQSMAVADGKNFTTQDETGISDKFMAMKNTMRDVWLSFVTTGNPISKGSSLPSWPAADANQSPHMSFGQQVELKGSLLEKRARFWDNIYQKYYRHPVSPPKPPPRHSEL